MRGIGWRIIVLVLGAIALGAPAAQAAICDLLGTCPVSDAHSTTVDGALQVDTDMAPLPAPAPGAPLFERVGGHLPLGLTERGYDGSSSLLGTAATAAQTAAFSRGIGGTLVRIPVVWAKVEPDPPIAGVHRYRWVRDSLYSGLVAHGVRPILTLLGAPRWASPPLSGCPTPCRQPPGPAHAADFAAFAAAVARRYPLAAAIEIWNEPNNHHGSVLGPDPAAYASLLGASYDAIKAARPAMRVLGGSLGAYGALADQPTTRRDMRLGDYLGIMLDRGAARHMDALSFHPYPHTTADDPDNDFFRVFSVVDGVLGAHAAGATRLVASEFGLSTSEAAPEARSQALQDRWHDLDTPDRPGAVPVPGADRVDAVIFHADINGVAGDRFGWMEVVTNKTTFRPLPVWCDFARMLAGQRSCPLTMSPAR